MWPESCFRKQWRAFLERCISQTWSSVTKTRTSTVVDSLAAVDGVRGLTHHHATKTITPFLLLLALLLVSCKGAAKEPNLTGSPEVQRDRATEGLPKPMKRGKAFRRGVSLGLFVSATDPEIRRGHYRTLLDEIRATGASDISLVVRWSQRDVEANKVESGQGVSVEDAVLEEVMALARARGLRVFLLPILTVRRLGEGQWRGTLAPADPEVWWASYTDFILHYAKIAQRNGVELLSIGSELSSMEAQRGRWTRLAAEVRKVFKAQLTYSANWDHFEAVGFWDAVDVVGITAYQELSKSGGPAEGLLVRGWRPFQERLGEWARVNKRGYIFTEVGYPSNTHAAARPWDHGSRSAPDLALQLRCYRAMFRVWHSEERLEGLYIWNWFGVGGGQDPGYTPRGKPARFVIERWYGDEGLSSRERPRD